MKDQLRRAALDALLARSLQLRERADYLLALHNTLSHETAPTHDRFNALARETHALEWQDYADRFTPLRALQTWLDDNTYQDAADDAEVDPADRACLNQLVAQAQADGHRGWSL